MNILVKLLTADSLACCTPGKKLARLPVDPMHGKVLLVSGEMGCSKEALAVVAMISTDTIFITPR